MKKTFRLEELGCANCAAKMEAAIGKLDGVDGVSINFMTQKLTLAAEDRLFDSILEQSKMIIRRIEPECAILS